MLDGKANLRQRTVAYLPGEGQLDKPHIKLIGNHWLELENHQGIIAYSSEQVKISLKVGLLIVTGQGLMIERVDREIVCLTGNIDQLNFGQ